MSNVVGYLPAAGAAARLCGLPKFLLPCPGGFLLDRHVRMMGEAGARDIYIAANRHNVGLIEQYAPPGCVTYLAPSKTMREALMPAGQWHAARPGLLAMPDTYWTDPDIEARLLAQLETCDVAVALWKTRPEQRPNLGMCDLDDAFNVLRIDDKPISTTLTFAWGALAWRPPFWFVMDKQRGDMGECLNDAINGGLSVKAVLAVGHYWDCGAPEEYFKLCATFVSKKVLA